ncbi:hypothetical protein CRG98_046168 [Punica granatum]|uniref:Alkane hydroxylase MAH1-like n=1 Tax=Punica granatum TaxID=22663 RepID=A0A2I0HNX6_PUNGR|nr:hypothetical protein CRG98_046168 [Punica granatum]
MGLLVILFALICFIVLCHLASNSKGAPTDWPLVGMLPTLLNQVSRVHDWVTELLLHLGTGNFLFRGPWFCNMDMLITADPANIHYIMTTNFVNFPKGPEFKNIFDILGDGIFNVDHELWKEQRRVAMSFINHKSFHCFLRYTFDSISKLVAGFDPECLSPDLPDVPFIRALDDAEEAIFFRHVMPGLLWKLQGWVGVGREKKLSEAWKCIDRIIGKYIEMKREKLRRGEESRQDEEDSDLLTSYMTMEKNKMSGAGSHEDKILRDTILSFIIAGRDTNTSSLTWFFWNLSNHPLVEIKIREEIRSLLTQGEDIFDTEEFNNNKKLVYLHGAICETLRLYPPIPLQHKSPAKPDKLPSGHNVQAHTRILWSLYAMGRMPSIWGKDCAEFKPERWISDNGTVRHEPSYKFVAFNAGPRTCLGKNFTFTQMKYVLATIIWNFHVRVEEDQDVRPRVSVILHMKHGLKARISRITNF